MFFTPPRLRALPPRQILAAHVGVYGQAIKRELACPTSCPTQVAHVELLCTEYNARMKLLHAVTQFEDKLKTVWLDEVD